MNSNERGTEDSPDAVDLAVHPPDSIKPQATLIGTTHDPISDSAGAAEYTTTDTTIATDGAESRITTNQTLAPQPYWNSSPGLAGTSVTAIPHPLITTKAGVAVTTEELDVRQGATSPTQIELQHKQEVLHMGCTCKKTRCLKLYCQCFALLLYCGPQCRCLNCHNVVSQEQARQEAMRLILLRNPNAFDTKFSKNRSVGSVMNSVNIVDAKHDNNNCDSGGTLSKVGDSDGPHLPRGEEKVLAHKVGCKCRKSNCVKKYCECYAGNVRCTANCRCIECKNMSLDANQKSILMTTASSTDRSTAHFSSPQQQLRPELLLKKPVNPRMLSVSQSVATQPPFRHLHPSQVMQQAAAAISGVEVAHNLGFLNNSLSSDGIHPANKSNDPKAMLLHHAMAELGQGSMVYPNCQYNVKRKSTQEEASNLDGNDVGHMDKRSRPGQDGAITEAGMAS